MSLNDLTPDARVQALRQMKKAGSKKNAAAMLAAPGDTGNTFTPPAAMVTPAAVTNNVGMRDKTPRGWEPRVVLDNEGKPSAIYSPAMPEELDEKEVLKTTLDLLAAMVPEGYWARLAEVRLDNGSWFRGAQGEDAVTKPVRRYRWVVEPVPDAAQVVAGMSETEWQAAVERIGKRKFPTLKHVTATTAVDLVVPHGDLQAGQGDGDSVEGLIARMSLYPVIVKAEIERLRRIGTPAKRLILPSLGDLIESVVGFYANQTWLVTLNMRQQRLLVRRLICAMIEELATLALPIIVPVVPGNHGENRNSKGKAFTDTSDNSDLEVMETVAEILGSNPRLAEQVKFHFPEEGDQTLTLDFGYGYGVGFHHGHLAGHGSGHAAAKAQGYLRSQAMAERPIGRAKYVITGHFHSAMLVTMPGNKMWVQIPALCDESAHFAEMYGLNGGPGLLTFTLGPDGLDNWRNHKVPTLSTVDAEIAKAKAAVKTAAARKPRATAAKPAIVRQRSAK